MFNNDKPLGQEEFLIDWPSLWYFTWRGFGTDQAYRSEFGKALPEFFSVMDLNIFVSVVSLELVDIIRKPIQINGSIILLNGSLEEEAYLTAYINNELRGFCKIDSFDILVYAPHDDPYEYNLRFELGQNENWYKSFEEIDFFFANNIPKELDLHFDATHSLSLDVNGGGSISKNPDQATYAYGASVELTATANPGWTFSSWLLDSVNVGSANPYTVTMNADHTLTAVFVEVPPSFEVITFDVIFETNTYVVKTCSNSSVSDLVFNQSLKRIRFNVDGPSGTTGLCNVTIPSELLSGGFSIYKDDTPLIKNVDYTETYNGTHCLFSIRYEHSTHMIEIIGTNVIPEFPSFLVLPLFTTTLLLAVIISRRKRATNA